MKQLLCAVPVVCGLYCFWYVSQIPLSSEVGFELYKGCVCDHWYVILVAARIMFLRIVILMVSLHVLVHTWVWHGVSIVFVCSC